MNQSFDPSQDPEQHRPRPSHIPESQGVRRQPFDNSGLNDLPQPGSEDPPYRDWWVVESSAPDSGPNQG